MDTEEKARRYDEALNWMREIYPGLHGATKEDAEHFFPELAASENEDEKARKFLVQHISEWIGCIEHDLKISSKDIESEKELAMFKAGLAYLEKQKEQKPELPLMGGDTDTYFDDLRITTKPLTSREWFDEGIKYAQRLQKEQKPSSQFRSGDWVVYDGPLGHAILQIEDVLDGRYTFVDNDSTLLVEDSDKFLRPLTQKDVEKKAECLKAERDGWYVCIKDFYVGGKKQCSVGDLVQAKGGMYMMGIEDISKWFRRAYYEDVRDAFGPNTDTNIPDQKPAEWSEEDKRFVRDAIAAVEAFYSEGCGQEELVNWLKSLRPSWKPSEEQMEALKYVTKKWEDGQGVACPSSFKYHAIIELYEQLKKLK